MGCFEGFSRFIVAIINTVFLIFGLAVLIVGIVFKIGWNEIRDAFDETDTINLQGTGDTLATACIVFGSVMFAIAIMGIIGACCDVKCALAIYGSAVGVILLAQIIVVALVATHLGEVSDHLVKGLKENLAGYKEEIGEDQKSQAWSAIFKNFECCGVEKPDDFVNMTLSQYRTQDQKVIQDPIPIACCTKSFDWEETKETTDLFQKNNDIKRCLKKTADYYYETGCETKMEDWINDHKKVIIGVGIAVFLVELMVVAMAFFLCCRHDD